MNSEKEMPFGDEPLEIEITDVFDLHSVPPRDVQGVVEAYLEAAHARGFTAIRIIHGRGIGVQREMVRSVLERTPYVLDYRDAPAEAGGWGATVATLGPPPDR
jgi:dsDNA-specific endonuclease/ATPase MutS2